MPNIKARADRGCKPKAFMDKPMGAIPPLFYAGVVFRLCRDMKQT